MARRKTGKENIRKLQTARGSYLVSIPISLVRALRWQAGQQVVFKMHGRKKLILADWPLKKKK